jgi:hypothetical protein
MADLPVACTLDPEGLKGRRSGLLRDLVARAARRDDRNDGLVFTFTPTADLLPLIAEVIEAERRCCRFLRFELSVAADEGPVRLLLSGPPGTREFLQDLFPKGPSC